MGLEPERVDLAQSQRIDTCRGQAEVFLTDDEDRHMVYMLSRVKWLPDIHLSLKEVR